jgi:Rrf2 family protein
MQSNSRFAVAIHVLALAKVARGHAAGIAVTSEQMAESVNTNPVVIRRILGSLRDAGLVASQPGPGGGWRLTRPATEITLRDVYRAVEAEPLFALPRREPNAACAVGKYLPHVLESCFRDAEAALEDRLARVSVADVIESVLAERGCAAKLILASVEKEESMTIS